MSTFRAKKLNFLRKMISFLILLAFILQPISPVYAQLSTDLPAPGTMMDLTNPFEAPMILGMTVHPENPLLFEFLIDRGQDKITDVTLNQASDKLVKYFLAAMTTPDTDAWVNLSPYEQNRIMPDLLSMTEMGKTMLEQDYILKQLSASLTNPEKKLGKKFWDEVKKRAFERFGTTDLPMATMNKVWIVPQKAVVFEKGAFVLIGERHLKVMLEEDYAVLSNQQDGGKSSVLRGDLASVRDMAVQELSSEVFRSLILPELEKEVNEGLTFAPVRQIYNAVILASWYKKNLRESLLGKIYVDKNKIAGIDILEKDLRERIYSQYLAAFQKGAYNLIQDEVDLASKETLPRKYFSGGTSFAVASSVVVHEDLARPSEVNRPQLQQIQGIIRRRGIVSAEVQLADSEALGRSLTQRASASVSLPRSQLYFGKLSNKRRGINVLENMYHISNFFGPRNDKGPTTILLVGVGYGVSALQIALRYPNFTIWAVNREKGLWSISEAIGRLNQIEKDRYTDLEILQALSRIKVVEDLDIEDDEARQKMLEGAPEFFDAVIIESNVSMYLTDQMRVFEKLFNEYVKKDGLFAFEVAFPMKVHPGDRNSSDEAIRSLIAEAFGVAGDIQLQDGNVTLSYTIERKRLVAIQFPLVKDWANSNMVGGQSSSEPRVFESRYAVRSSSSLTTSDLHRNYAILGTLLVLTETGNEVLQSITAKRVANKIHNTYSDINIPELSINTFLKEIGATSLPGTQEWAISPEVWIRIKQQLIYAAIKTSLTLEVEKVATELEDLVKTDTNEETDAENKVAFLREWMKMAKAFRSGLVTDKTIAQLGSDSLVRKFFASSQNTQFISRLLVDGSRIARESLRTPLEQDIVPIVVRINHVPRILNVSEDIAGDGTLSETFKDEIVRLIENLKDYEVVNIVTDPQLDNQIIYVSTNRTVIIPRIGLVEMNSGLEAKIIKVTRSSSAIKEQPVTVISSDVEGAIEKGGIDFNPALFDLQIKRDGKGVPLPLPQQNIENIHIDGLYPVIIDIQPASMQNFPLLLSALDQ